MMEATSTSETLVNFYQITWNNNPEDNHLHEKGVFTSKTYGGTGAICWKAERKLYVHKENCICTVLCLK
jgi:hypothetical protein